MAGGCGVPNKHPALGTQEVPRAGHSTNRHLRSPVVARLPEKPLGEVLDDVAAATPAPGGGSSAALACALGAALVEMAAGLGLARGVEIPAEASERAHELRARALELAQEELSSYAPVLEALRLPADDPERPGRLEAALSAATESPLAIAEAAAGTAELGARVAAGSRRDVRGDAITGAVLAEAAAAAATGLVEINLERRGDDPRLERGREAARRAREARRRAEEARGRAAAT
jgi:formiminotetrahydrofolate cyclodeaminase